MNRRLTPRPSQRQLIATIRRDNRRRGRGQVILSHRVGCEVWDDDDAPCDCTWLWHVNRPPRAVDSPRGAPARR